MSKLFPVFVRESKICELWVTLYCIIEGSIPLMSWGTTFRNLPYASASAFPDQISVEKSCRPDADLVSSRLQRTYSMPESGNLEAANLVEDFICERSPALASAADRREVS